MENNYINLRDYKKQIETIWSFIVADVYLGDVYANETDHKLAKVTKLLDEAVEILEDLLIDKTI